MNTLTLNSGASLQSAINSAANGDTIILNDGSFPGGANFNGKSGITVKAANTGKATITGGQISGGTSITLAGFNVSNVSTPLQVGAVQIGDGWNLTDINLANFTSVGFKIAGSHVRGARCTASGGYLGWGTQGYSATQLITDNVLTDCAAINCNIGFPALPASWAGSANVSQKKNGQPTNLFFIESFWEGGGIKYCQCDGLTLIRFKANGNGGPGIWGDVGNKAVTIIDPEAIGNFGIGAAYEGDGIASEISYGPLKIVNPHTKGNSGSSIAIWEAQNITVTGGLLEDTGIEFRDLDGRGMKCLNVLLDSIKLYGTNAKVGYWGSQTAAVRSAENLVEKNLQYITSGAAPTWAPSGQTPVVDPPANVTRTEVTQINSTNTATTQMTVGGKVFTLISGQIYQDGTARSETSGVLALYSIAGKLHQLAGSGWWILNGSTGTSSDWASESAPDTSSTSTTGAGTTPITPTGDDVATLKAQLAQAQSDLAAARATITTDEAQIAQLTTAQSTLQNKIKLAQTDLAA